MDRKILMTALIIIGAVIWVGSSFIDSDSQEEPAVEQTETDQYIEQPLSY